MNQDQTYEDKNETYKGRVFSFEVFPGDKYALLKLNGRAGHLAKIRNATLIGKIVEKQGFIGKKITHSGFESFVDDKGIKTAAFEARKGNLDCRAVLTQPNLDVVVDKATGMVVNPTQIQDRDRVGRY